MPEYCTALCVHLEVGLMLESLYRSHAITDDCILLELFSNVVFWGIASIATVTALFLLL